MSQCTNGVTVICPGLVGPLPCIPERLPRTPVLDLWLGRGQVSHGERRDPDHAVLEAFGLHSTPDQAPPTGPICLLGDDPSADLGGYWMHADPVHLRPDRDQLLVFAGDDLQPSQEEAQALVEAFNLHFADDHLLLVAPTPGRWYLRVPKDPGLRTVPLHQVQGQPMLAHLPEGPRLSEWMRLMNEVQMLFHAHPVNAVCESRGRPMLNGLWAWGGGRLPAPPVNPPSLLIGDHPLIRGLSRLGGGQQLPASGGTGASILGAGNALVFEDALWRALRDRDLDAWQLGLEALEARCAEIDAQLRGAGLSSIQLDPCDGRCWSMTPSRLRRFWRRGGLRRLLSARAAQVAPLSG
ncbi:phosphoglycerate mutase [Thiorhodococcus mannitoliphagus]|uniref:Phosphoglycerate mutase n=1 Tax=Thiorhodococcus mannitoliphagus TaxID=329406 RepID=A0A6P1DTL4_9GAMM|nr:phosphoglycerate mutase [Thiorhodococcus mannitoliphagus]NEX20533.1 phosphoglycerate mutase [Thiorhodococcus mannitoliphagus]